MGEVLGRGPIWYTQERLESEKVSKSYVVWMLTKDPAMRKDMKEKESSEVVKKRKFTPRIVVKTLGNMHDKVIKPTANPSTSRSVQKPVTKTSSIKERLDPKVVPVRERLGPWMASTKKKLCLGGVVSSHQGEG